jgi:hypothetical protein
MVIILVSSTTVTKIEQMGSKGTHIRGVTMIEIDRIKFLKQIKQMQKK